MEHEQKFWAITASADHAANGQRWGIVQACHGKSAPLRRMRAGDGVVIYSPKTGLNAGDALMAFTAIGRISNDQSYQFDMGNGFLPWRRQVQWQPVSNPLPIRPLLQQLDLTKGLANWGTIFRYGLTALSRADFIILARQMVLPGQAIPFRPESSHMTLSR